MKVPICGHGKMKHRCKICDIKSSIHDVLSLMRVIQMKLYELDQEQPGITLDEVEKAAVTLGANPETARTELEDFFRNIQVKKEQP